MAEANAVHITATDSDGNIVHDSYTKESDAHRKIRNLKEEFLTVKAEVVSELPEGVELAE